MRTGTGPDSSREDGLQADSAGYGPHNPPPESHGEHDEHEHESKWPLVAALGAGGLYSGVAIALLGAAAGVLPPVVGVVLAVLGTIVLLAGVAGWVDQAFLGTAREGHGKSRESYVSTTLLFLATDVSTFGALFVYYFLSESAAGRHRSCPRC